MSALELDVRSWSRTVAETSGQRRWLATGRAVGPDPRRVGAQAAAQAMAAPDAALLVVFCAGADDPAAVLAGIHDVAEGVPLVGCSAEAVIAPDGEATGVVVAALGGPGFAVTTSTGLGVSGRQRDAGAEAARCAVPLPERPNRALLMLSDGDAPHQEAILAGAYSVVGAGVPLVGGASSPCPGEGRTFQLHGREVLTDAVVAAAIGSAGPLAVASRHGYTRIDRPMIVTRSVDGTVRTLDDEPAVAVYLNRLGAPAEAYRDPIAFERFAQTRPVGVRRRTGLELRDVSYGEYLRDGWLYSTGDIPEGSMIWLMDGDTESTLTAAGRAAEAAVDGLGGRPALGILAFDCISRSGLLGVDGMRNEVGRMVAGGGWAPVAGFYTWGEIARTRGVFGFHNQTLALLALG